MTSVMFCRIGRAYYQVVCTEILMGVILFCELCTEFRVSRFI